VSFRIIVSASFVMEQLAVEHEADHQRCPCGRGASWIYDGIRIAGGRTPPIRGLAPPFRWCNAEAPLQDAVRISLNRPSRVM